MPLRFLESIWRDHRHSKPICRTGRRVLAEPVQVKFNPYHDPKNGRFTFAPGGARSDQLKSIAAAKAAPVTADQLRRIMPRAGANADKYVDALNPAMIANGIDTIGQRAAFLGQIAAETGDLSNLTEDLYYKTPGRLQKVYGRGRFPTLESEKPHLRNPERLANYVYAALNGNGDGKSGDGWRYRGRGMIQVTFRDNYRLVGFEDNPEALTAPLGAAVSAARYWVKRGPNALTNRLSTRELYLKVTRLVNRPALHFDVRWSSYLRALAVLQPVMQKPVAK